MSNDTMEEGQHANLQLHVCNTFLHVKDANFETQKAQCLKRSSSDSSLDSKSLSSEHKPEPILSGSRATRVEGCPAHLVWNYSDTSWSINDSGSSSDTGIKSPSICPLPSPATPTCGVRVGAAESHWMETNNQMEHDPINTSALPMQLAPQGLVPHTGYSAVDLIPELHLRPSPEQSSSAEQAQMKQGVASASVEATRHEKGTCRPCVFWLRDSCSKGDRCPYCHQSHKAKKIKQNKPSKKVHEQKRGVTE